MSKPRIFVGSSVEALEVAYAVQEGLERDLEVTVWTQGIFTPSRYTMDALASAVLDTDFALFVFKPEDVTIMRGAEHQTVRDNVIFELGMFIGRLGRERCFILVPRDSGEIHLPSDLLGLTPLDYEAGRTDGNLLAALGPACQRVKRSAAQAGLFAPVAPPPSEPETDEVITDAGDALAILRSWMGGRRHGDNSSAINYAAVDRELRLAPGMTKEHIEEAAERWGYEADVIGSTTILLKKT